MSTHTGQLSAQAGDSATWLVRRWSQYKLGKSEFTLTPIHETRFHTEAEALEYARTADSGYSGDMRYRYEIIPPQQGNKMIPETVILDMQKKAYERREALLFLRQEAAFAQKNAEIAKSKVSRAETELKEIADFLQEHNADALDGDETWAGALELSI